MSSPPSPLPPGHRFRFPLASALLANAREAGAPPEEIAALEADAEAHGGAGNDPDPGPYAIATATAARALAAGYAPSRDPVRVYLASLAPRSRETMRKALARAASILSGGAVEDDVVDRLPWPSLRNEHLAALRSALAERLAPATGNLTLSAVKGVLRAAWRLGYLSAEELARAVDVPPVRGERVPKGRALSSGELRALFAACADSPHAAIATRDSALLGVMFGAGLRRAEVVALDRDDVTETPEAPDVLTVTVRAGKGNKGRVLYVDNGARDALAAWLELRGDAPGPLFVAVTKGGRIRDRRLADGAIYHLATRRARDARIARFSPHDARRTCASALWESTPGPVIQSILGHSSIETSARYSRLGERAKQTAAGSVHVPFIPPRER